MKELEKSPYYVGMEQTKHGDYVFITQDQCDHPFFINAIFPQYNTFICGKCHIEKSKISKIYASEKNPDTF
jgi:hypothetical protein